MSEQEKKSSSTNIKTLQEIEEIADKNSESENEKSKDLLKQDNNIIDNNQKSTDMQQKPEDEGNSMKRIKQFF